MEVWGSLGIRGSWGFAEVWGRGGWVEGVRVGGSGSGGWGIKMGGPTQNGVAGASTDVVVTARDYDAVNEKGNME